MVHTSNIIVVIKEIFHIYISQEKIVNTLSALQL